MPQVLTPNNHELVGEILDIAYADIQEIPLGGLIGGSRHRIPEVIGISGVCWEMSDAVTRAAHQIGIVASRELRKGHGMTSFGPLDEPLGDNDLIICTTWGQFAP